jgi:CheY-like chemotaxis protein
MAKLMLVEDDNNLREIYEARLQAEGYTIVTARDGEEALVVAKAEKPDLVIADVMMPKISGFEMLDIMRNTEGLKDVKVIMLTALGQSDDQQRADKLGADRYLVKSQVTLEDIVKVTHDLLGDGTAPAPAPADDSKAPSGDAKATEPTEPKPEPAPLTEPSAITVKAEPPSELAADETAEKEDAQSTAQEEAGVEARIEDFVAGATEEATAPAPVTQVPVTTSDEPAPEPAAQTADDKLMADAVDNLVASTPATEKSEETKAEETATPEPAAAAESAPASASTGGTKVIEPLDSPPKKDIHELLAAEEAKENQTGPAPAKPAGDTVDPNSIAL